MQFIDLKKQYLALKKDIDKAIQSVLDEGQYILGKQVEELEKSLAQYVGVRHCVTCANGTDALQLAFMYYGITEGDAVFCPDITFIATVEPACMLGATPVFCDIDSGSYNIDTKLLEQRIVDVIKTGRHRPKAVVAVDFLGNPADYDSLAVICKKYNLILIEDAAQSFGSIYKGKRCGSFGDLAVTSFFPAKPLGCYGDGGAIFTNDDETADILKSLRVHGKGNSKYENIRVGVNSRLDTIQAAILQVKLKVFAEYEFEARQEVAKRYNSAFKDYFQIQEIPSDYKSSYAQYALLCKNKDTRDNMMQYLTDHDIPSMIYYPTPQHSLEVHKINMYNDVSFKNSNDYCEKTISIPMHPYLSSDDQSYIIKTVDNFLAIHG